MQFARQRLVKLIGDNWSYGVGVSTINSKLITEVDSMNHFYILNESQSFHIIFYL